MATKRRLIEKHPNKSAKQLKESWNRYSWCVAWKLKLERAGVDCSFIIERIKDKHYTLTEKKFEEIKDYYNLRIEENEIRKL